MSAKHTPGPWQVRTIDASIGSVDAADGSAVAQAQMRGTLQRHNHQERRANARLIAAAPELLEALEFITNCMDWGSSLSGKGIAIEKARAAIAKATGEGEA